MNKLDFTYDLINYRYFMKTGLLHTINQPEEYYGDTEYLMELPSELKEHLIGLIPSTAVDVLKSILFIYSRGIDKGRISKAEEIREALGL